MTEQLGGYQVADPDLQRRQSVLLVPALLATCIGVPLLALGVLEHVVGEVLVHTHPHWLNPGGATYVPPTGAQRVRDLVRAAVPAIASLGALFLTWRSRRRGLRLTTTLGAAATILLAASVVW
jgi:hypothetical protein